MMAILLALLIFVSAGFVFIASIGAIRFPDSLTRMLAISKSISLALVLMAAVIAIWFGTLESALKMLGLIGFVLITSPVSAHLMARSARAQQLPLSERTQGVDQWPQRCSKKLG